MYEVIGDCKRLQNENIRGLFSSPNVEDQIMKKDDTCWTQQAGQ